MLPQFLSKLEINDQFLKQICTQLKKDLGKKWSDEENEILSKLLNDFESRIGRKTFTDHNAHFSLMDNEFNFLLQNKKSLWAEYLIFRYKFKIYPVIKKLTNFPTHLLVEPVSYCNLKCVMCFQSDRTFLKTQKMGCIDLKFFRKVIDEAVENKCCALTLASRGEPTLHPQFEEILKYAKGKFFDFKLNTNATLMDEKKCHHILRNGVTELVFSLESIDKAEYEQIRRNGNFDQVLANIKRFHDIRKKKYPHSKCKTRISAVKYSKNFDVNSFVKFWSPMVDRVACVNLVERWDSYNNQSSKKTFPCQLLWERMYVWFDGVANPCDFDYKSSLRVGNVPKNTIKEIWGGKKFFDLRNKHLMGKRNQCHPCALCHL